MPGVFFSPLPVVVPHQLVALKRARCGFPSEATCRCKCGFRELPGVLRAGGCGQRADRSWHWGWCTSELSLVQACAHWAWQCRHVGIPSGAQQQHGATSLFGPSQRDVVEGIGTWCFANKDLQCCFLASFS